MYKTAKNLTKKVLLCIIYLFNIQYIEWIGGLMYWMDYWINISNNPTIIIIQ